MAKRRRLSDMVTDPRHLEIEEGVVSPRALGRKRAPIALEAGDAAAASALEEVSHAYVSARNEGRMLIEVPLKSLQTDHLIRDRMAPDDDEMSSLMESLRQRGQQTPIEVVETAPGKFGLISGWRRVEALRRLGKDGALALLRRPETAAAAYIAMVEENEIRSGLSYFERARIAAIAHQTGLYPDTARAVQALFGSASRAKRSKINSFVTLYRLLGGSLRFPSAIPERLGLALVSALEGDGARLTRLRDRLRKATPENAAAEMALLQKALRDTGKAPAAAPREDIAPGLALTTRQSGKAVTLTLTGKAVTPNLRARLVRWLTENGGT